MAKTNKKNAKDKEKAPTVTIKLEWILLGILFIVFILSIFTAGFTQLPYNLKSPFSGLFKDGETLTTDEIKERLTKFINEELLQGQGTAEITEVTLRNRYKELLKIVSEAT